MSEGERQLKTVRRSRTIQNIPARDGEPTDRTGGADEGGTGGTEGGRFDSEIDRDEGDDEQMKAGQMFDKEFEGFDALFITI